MIAIPAVDIRDGACVQLVGGSYAAERIRLDDPASIARAWQDIGFRRLHVVDLDAATGRGNNARVVTQIIDEARVDVEAGGGVRSTADLEKLVAAGARFVIIGTRAIESREWLAEITARYPGRIIVAADVRGRDVVTHGWNRMAPIEIGTLIDEIACLPLAAVLVTAVHVEGSMTGPDLPLVDEIVTRTSIPLIASGGIRSADDLRALAHRGVEAAVIGMALYTGALDARAVAKEFSE